MSSNDAATASPPVIADGVDLEKRPVLEVLAAPRPPPKAGYSTWRKPGVISRPAGINPNTTIRSARGQAR